MRPSRPNTFGLILFSTADGTRPANAFGVSVTPAQNSYGSYASLISGASLTDDCYEIEIIINSVAISAAARDCVVSIGLDAAGGTSFTSIVDLVCGPAPAHTANTGGVFYRFPLWIKAGTSIGAAAAVNSATLTAINVFCRAKCRPSRPDRIMVGRYIDQFGVTLASSCGTSVTEGTTSEGSWTQLGSNLTRPCWYWDFGFGCNNATMSNAMSHVDLGVGNGTSNNIIISNAPVMASNVEQIGKMYSGGYGWGSTGDGVYVRSQTSTANTGVTISAYGVGG